MLNITAIEKPTLILDEARARRNLANMAARARRCGVRFRPHFKTHQSAEMGEWFRQEGVQAITVSSVDMAAYFANAGWQDILIAFSANLRQAQPIDELAGRIHLELLVESAETVRHLRDHLTHAVDMWIKVDVGARRTGIPVANQAALLDLAREIRDCGFHFKGLLTHNSQTYHPEAGESIQQIYQRSVDSLAHAKEALVQAGFPETQLSYGDTPACSVVDDFTGLDEIRPGNFIFYDLMQLSIGVCSEEDIAVAVACPVVAKHSEDGNYRLILYGGAVHLSKEFMEVSGGRRYGGLAPITQEGWGKLLVGARLYSLSQEHGLAVVSQEQYQAVQVGELIGVVPVHSCLTVDLFDSYLTTSGISIGIKR